MSKKSTFIMYNDVTDIPNDLSVDDHVIFILDMKHPEFENRYTDMAKRGFRYPLISTKFFYEDLKRPHLFLYKKYNHNYTKQVDDSDSTIKAIQFALRTYRDIKQDRSCKIHIVLHDDAVDYLKKYSEKLKFKSHNGEVEQREISGKLLLYETTPNTFLIKIDEKSSDLGGKEETASFNTLGSFHTHPLDAYHKYKVCAAWPSVEDYATFLSIYSKGYGMFHLLGTVEGIYVITVSTDMIEEGREKIRDNFKYYANYIKEHYHRNYPLCSSLSRTYKFSSPTEIEDKAHIHKPIHSYIKNMNENLKYLFLLQP